MTSYLGFKAEIGVEGAHLTVLYLGECTEEQERVVGKFLDEYRDVLPDTAYVARGSFALFGPENDIPVLQVTAPKHLWALRKLSENHLWNGSEFLDWNPHITLRPKPAETVIISPMIRVSYFGLY